MGEIGPISSLAHHDWRYQRPGLKAVCIALLLGINAL